MIPHSKPSVGILEQQAVKRVLNSGFLARGKVTELLEQTMQDSFPSKGAIATTSCSRGLSLILVAKYGLSRPEVALPSYVCRSIYDAIATLGFRPILCDIDPETLAIDPDDSRLRGVKAIIVPHMFGIRAPVEKFLGRGHFIIEDLAQRIAPEPVRMQEISGDAQTLSFEATKLLTAGEGGICLTNDLDLARQIRNIISLAADSSDLRYRDTFTDIQAAMAIEQWKQLDTFLGRRKEIALRYLHGLPHETIHPSMFVSNTYHFRFLIQTNDPDRFIQFAASRGVSVRRPVSPIPLHQLFDATGVFPHTDSVMKTIVSLPIYPTLSEDQVDKVLKVANDTINLIPYSANFART